MWVRCGAVPAAFPGVGRVRPARRVSHSAPKGVCPPKVPAAGPRHSAKGWKLPPPARGPQGRRHEGSKGAGGPCGTGRAALAAAPQAGPCVPQPEAPRGDCGSRSPTRSSATRSCERRRRPCLQTTTLRSPRPSGGSDRLRPRKVSAGPGAEKVLGSAGCFGAC